MRANAVDSAQTHPSVAKQGAQPQRRIPIPSSPPKLDRWFWLAMLLAAAVVIPRTAMISVAHSPMVDDQWHLRRGMAFLTRTYWEAPLQLNNPPLGDAVLALPMWVTGCLPGKPLNRQTIPPPFYREPLKDAVSTEQAKTLQLAHALRVDVLYGHWLRPDTVLLLIALWKAILFVPFAGLVFHWCRGLYGLPAGWLGLGMLLVEPSIASQIGPACVDILSVEAVLAACYLVWRAVQSPSRWRLVAATGMTAAAMLVKNTAVILPMVFAAMTLCYWIVRSRQDGASWTAIRKLLRSRLNGLAWALVLLVLWLWALMQFDISVPHERIWRFTPVQEMSKLGQLIDPALTHRWPCGLYIASLFSAMDHSLNGHWGYLLGENRIGGWWYYFPVVAAYKVPVGLALVLAMGMASLLWIKPRLSELALLLPALCWTGLMLTSRINVGFRHFLPAYVAFLMLATRCVAGRGIGWKIAAWLGVAAAGLHALTYHPDYVAYFNWPRHKPYLAINDSNVDWGQAVKQVAKWLDEHPQHGRDVYIAYHRPADRAMHYFLGNRAKALDRIEPQPTHGLLIISPQWEAGLYYDLDTYAALRPLEPVATIGHCMQVYDLDKLSGGKGFVWPPAQQSRQANRK